MKQPLHFQMLPAILLALADEKQNIIASTTLGDFYANHALAGLEIITPHLIADTVVTN